MKNCAFATWPTRIASMLDQGWRLADVEFKGEDIVAGWHAMIEHHGVVVGRVADNGRGGFECRLDGEAEGARFLSAAANAGLEQPDEDLPMADPVVSLGHSYWIYDRMLQLVDENRATVFRLASDEPVHGTAPPLYRFHDQPYSEAAAESLARRYGGDLVEVVNQSVRAALRAEERYFEAYGLSHPVANEAPYPAGPARRRTSTPTGPGF